MPEVYEPSDDSFLLAKHVKSFAYGDVLDMGTGSGILAEAAASSKKVKTVVGADINPDAIKRCRNTITNKKISFIETNLFNKIKKKFDTIVFNPPYLPDEGFSREDIDLVGGKKGYEVIENFLEDANDYLNNKGQILLLFSSQTGKDEVERIIEENLFAFQNLEGKNIFFESLFVYKITKTNILSELSKKGISEIKNFTHGKRGLIYTGLYEKKKVAVKVKNPRSKAISRIDNESNWIKRLNKKGIGPELLFSGEGFLAYKFVEGIFIFDFIKESNRLKISKILKDVFDQLRKMDLIGVDKEEMHRPYKHIIIQKNKKPVLIDFERCRITEQPKNVTQFCQYITSDLISSVLEKKGFQLNKKEIINKSRFYKKDFSKKHFEDLMNEIFN